VVAWWFGGFNDAQSLTITTSSDGVSWSDPQGLLGEGSGNVDYTSRLSLTYFYPGDLWCLAWRDAATLQIMIDAFQFNPANPGPGSIAPMVNTGVVTSRAPTISYVGNQLVLAFQESSSNQVRILTSSDGVTWTASPGVPVVVAGAPLTTEASPYLSNSLGTLYLATTASNPGRIVVSSTSDGINWTPLSPGSVGVAGWSDADPSIAGPPEAMVVAYPNGSGLQKVTLLGSSAGPESVATNSTQGVGVVQGP
jgi:hypothetical protein